MKNKFNQGILNKFVKKVIFFLILFLFFDDEIKAQSNKWDRELESTSKIIDELFFDKSNSSEYKTVFYISITGVFQEIGDVTKNEVLLNGKPYNDYLIKVRFIFKRDFEIAQNKFYSGQRIKVNGKPHFELNSKVIYIENARLSKFEDENEVDRIKQPLLYSVLFFIFIITGIKVFFDHMTENKR